jgi:hypothetical protein
MIKRKGNQMFKLITCRGSPIGSAVHLGAVTVSQSLFHALVIFAYIFVWNHLENRLLEHKQADYSGRAVQGMNCFRKLECWDRWLESY